MASIKYWDYRVDSTSTSTASDIWTTTAFSGTSTTTSSTNGVWFRRPRRALVEEPKSWDKAARAAFTRLMNDETATGWTIEMWIDGNILITDPDIDVRSLKDWVLLVKQRASHADRAKIDAFFEAFPIEDA